MDGKPNAKLSRAVAIALAALIWMTSAAVLGGCGKKGPPEPPSGSRPPRVTDLNYIISENTVKLSWTIPQPNEKAQYPVSGFLIFQYKQPLYERECPDCPLIFTQIGDVPVRGETAGRDESLPLVFVETIEKGYRYKFKVKAYSDDGTSGADSNFVEFSF